MVIAHSTFLYIFSINSMGQICVHAYNERQSIHFEINAKKPDEIGAEMTKILFLYEFWLEWHVNEEVGGRIISAHA